MAKRKPAPNKLDILAVQLRRWARLGLAGLVALVLLAFVTYRFVPVVWTPYQASEGWRLGHVDRKWVSFQEIAPVMARSVVAAEDANFCEHWGFDIGALRHAIDDGYRRGGSTISQQTVKNVFLWQGRSWPRKALEAMLTPLGELIWGKKRILEIYLNVIEFDTGVFGIEAASQHYFGIPARQLNATQAARLAAILPDPKDRSASHPGAFTRKRAVQIIDGAATIARDGRDRCFAG